MPRNVTIYRSKAVSPDTSTYLNARVKSEPSAPTLEAADLDMGVEFSFDCVTAFTGEFYGGQWEQGTAFGLPIKYRMAHLLMTDANLPADGRPNVFVRPIDNPEQPWLNAGNLTIL